jgi:DUF917 family protein
MSVLADEGSLRAMVYGGAVLGGGGGGSLAGGLNAVRDALKAGRPRVVPLDRIPRDAILATLSAVGSVDGAGRLDEAHFDRAITLLETLTERSAHGFIASEVGPRAVTYGLLQSARSGRPVVDAPCNGRAHPLFAMGSLGLHLHPSRLSATAAVGGRKGATDHVEMAIRSNVATAARLVRQTAARSGALAVARNPLPADWVRRHAAVGGLARAAEVGRTLLQALPAGPAAVLDALTRRMGGRILTSGTVAEVRLRPSSGFTLGEIRIADGRGGALRLPTCNEFMAAIVQGRPLAAFPDLITLFDLDTGLPLASSEVRSRQPVAVFAVAKERLLLGSPMRDARLLRPIEKRLGTTRSTQAPKYSSAGCDSRFLTRIQRAE